MKGYNTIYIAEIGSGYFEFEVTSYGIEIKESDRRDDDYAFLILDYETLEVIEEGYFNTVWGEEYICRIQDYLKKYPLPKFSSNE